MIESIKDTTPVVGRIHSLESFGTVDGPGIRFVVFFQGCPMRCQFCHNPDTWTPTLSDGNIASGHGEWTAQALVEEVERYRNFIKTGGVTATGGEPLMQAVFLRDFFRLCHQHGFTTCLDTSGIYPLDAQGGAVREAIDESDLVMLDIKTLDDTIHRDYVGHDRTNNQLTLEYLQQSCKPTWVRHVVVPGITDDDARLHALASHVAQYDVVERIEVLAYHTLGKAKYENMGLPYPLDGVPDLQKDRLENARAIFRQHVSCKVL